MRKQFTRPLRLLSLLFIVLAISSCGRKGAETNGDKGKEQKITDLLSEMTIEEKVGQMTQITLEVILKTDDEGDLIEPHEIDPEKLDEALNNYHVGSILNCGGHAYGRDQWYEIISTIQERAIKDTRMGIPIIYGIDAIHGVNYTLGATLFPQQIGLAATWNPSLVKQAGAISAYETRASSIPWNFSPVLGMGRHPAWPRFWETFGEDVYLTKTMGNALIEGYEGDDISGDEKVASCMKHYLGYSFPLSGKDRTPAWIPERMLREIFLPPFKSAVDMGSMTVMVNSAEINGIPAHASKFLLSDLLKDELGFNGFIVSDWQDIKYLHDRHHVAPTQKEAVKMSIDAGLDMSMVPTDYSFTGHLTELVKEGSISEERLDESVRRILRVKLALDLFEKPYTNPTDYKKFASEEFRMANLQSARESITLLKNDNNLLPLNKNSKLLVTGPGANTMVSLNGGWTYTWQGEDTDEYAGEYNTVLEAIEKKIGKNNVRYEKGSSFEEIEDLRAVKRAAASADKILLCLGETAYTEKPGDINDLYISDAQKELAKTAISTGKPVILLLTEGRPRLISKFANEMDAILMAYLPGNEGGNAIPDVLFGDVNPSGKLPFSYPRYPNDLVTYDHKHTEAIGPENGDNAYNPQFPFGYGLSYTSFNYENLNLDKSSIDNKGELTISVDVSNSGKRQGKEVVQLYIGDLYASITPSVKRLRGFEKIDLQPGETKTVSFTLNADDLSFIGRDNQWITEAGTFKVMIDKLESTFELK
ncbi:MAG: glycoside hydrolase family 3 C-terminal domain-containing protein [Bacteroidales bacterium]|nr:glycoside hydrolase family 3 C-terminal domain-containing protein [Bacteroidales bacterium]